jgi:hypothetical protein
MSDPKLCIDVGQKGRHFAATRTLDPHIESRRKMEGLQVVAPRKAEMMVAPPARNREIEFVAPAALKRPAVFLHGLLEHIERMELSDRLLLLGQAHPHLLRVIGKTKQVAANLTQDFVARQESGITCGST